MLPITGESKQTLDPAENEKPKKKKNKEGKTDRGIETMFRITARNHLELSSIADNKANIMISVNSIILTIVVSVLLRKLEEFPNFIIPTIMLLLTSLVTLVFAILATRPNVTSGRVTQDDIEQKKSNLLYFGNFFNMDLNEYLAGVNVMMKDRDFLYDTMIRDIYSLGKVLNRKYMLLRKSYNIFMFGFILTVVSYLVAALFFPADVY